MRTTIAILALALLGCAEGQYRYNPRALNQAQQWTQGMTTGNWAEPSTLPATNCLSTSRYDIYGSYIGEAVQCGR